jgi:glycosyltransferase involved in cell wall biosynthesis
MRVHHVITKSQGGAATATGRIHAALLALGVESRVYFAAGPERGEGWQRGFVRAGKTAGGRVRRLGLSLARRAPVEQFTLSNPGVATCFPAGLFDCDVLHLHWLGDALLDLDALSAALPPDLPLVWRLSDLHALTAGCHYPGECRQYLESAGCRLCPFFRPIPGGALTRGSFAAKLRFFRRHPVHLVAISEWTHELAVRSPLGRAARSVNLIFNPFRPACTDRPPSRAEARRILGLEPNATWICYGADHAGNSRKGIDDFLGAMPIVQKERPDTRIAIVGAGGDHPLLGALPRSVALGRLEPRQLDLVFAAADVFAMPTREEALGQMGLEAICQGTPTVCYADSGPCSYVMDGVTGRQVGTRNPAAFAEGLLAILNDPERYAQSSVRAAYEEHLVPRFSTEGQAARYAALYRSLRRAA